MENRSSIEDRCVCHMAKSADSNQAGASAPPFGATLMTGQRGAEEFAAFLAAAFNPCDPGAACADAVEALQQRLQADHAQLWTSLLAKSQGQAASFEIVPEPGDRRFNAAEWQDGTIFQYFTQSYLLNARYLRELAEILPCQDDKSEKTRKRMRFIARQIGDAMAPSNFAATNPEFIKSALDSGGQSIAEGIAHLIEDLEKGRISTSDELAFEVGVNLAITEGAVVFENEVMQLIQYAPRTPTVSKRPLLIVPPCINKFYIMDMQPESSFICFMLEQGTTVFLVSWRVPGEAQKHLTWDDYLEQGPITALRVTREICRKKEVNALGFCIGGTLLTSALAVLNARGEQLPTSLTLMTTLLDFTETGDIGLLIDEDMLKMQEATVGKGGILPARELLNVFSFLRPNEQVWNSVSDHYLKGRKRKPFDLMFWGSDSTSLAGPFACWYMRNMYHENRLCQPGQLSMCGAKIDLSQLKMPTYLMAAREDHIVPWQSAYASTRVLGGGFRFVLGASGHIAGAINPASKNRRSYWLNDDVTKDADTWLAMAEERNGSWWNDWATWLKEQGGGERKAKKMLGSKAYPVIEPAPGRYVKERAC